MEILALVLMVITFILARERGYSIVISLVMTLVSPISTIILLFVPKKTSPQKTTKHKQNIYQNNLQRKQSPLLNEKNCRWYADNEKKILKWIGIFMLFIPAIIFWYISAPTILVWYVWKKAKWNKKKKYIMTTLAVILLFILTGLNFHANRTPSLIVLEPNDNFTIQAEETTICGTVDPKNATLNINNATVKTENGVFNYSAKLTEEKNNFILKVSNKNGKYYWQQIIINRIFTEEELAEQERQKVEEEAKRQAAIEAQKKAEDERKAKKIAEQKAWERSKAGQICKTHPEWTKTDCELLADNKIWIGMTIDMLIYKRGRPNSANPSNYGSGNEWQWCWFPWNNGPSCFYGGDDGIITSYN